MSVARPALSISSVLSMQDNENHMEGKSQIQKYCAVLKSLGSSNWQLPSNWIK